jgi:hypothetical protein
MKNIFILAFLTLITFASYSQTASLEKIYAKPGDVIYMPVTASNFKNIGALGFYIDYDKNVLDYLGIENVNPAVSSILYNYSDNILKAGWYSPDAVSSITADNEKLYDIKFLFKGGSTDVVFDNNASVIGDIEAANQNPVSNYINGFVGEANRVIENTNNLSLNIYPNPTNGLLNVVISANRLINNISLFTVEGKEIYNHANIKVVNASVDLSNRAPGIYFLRIESNNDILYRKVIKE